MIQSHNYQIVYAVWEETVLWIFYYYYYCYYYYCIYNASDLKACYHSNSNSVSWEIYSWAANEAHQDIFITSKFALCAKYPHIVMIAARNLELLYW